MFGFERLAAFTHDLETAFDLVRNGRLEITPELIDLTLAALDQIGAMLKEGIGGAAPADPAACAGILANVRRLAAIEERPSRQKEPSGAASGSRSWPASHQNWRIRFAPGPDLMRYGANPSLLLANSVSWGPFGQSQSWTRCLPSASSIPSAVTSIGRWIWRPPRRPRGHSRRLHLCRRQSANSRSSRGCARAPASQRRGRQRADITARALEEKRAGSAGRRTYDKPDNASSLRVPAAKLDQFVDLVGELVTVQARLSELAGRRDDAEITAVSEEVERLTSALRESSMNIRMMPIRGTFEKFRRLVHDLARDLHKNVELTIEGADTELDKTVIEQLSDPLMHLIRNSMDHGIEPAGSARGPRQASGSDHSSFGAALGRQCAGHGHRRRPRHRCGRRAQRADRERPDLCRGAVHRKPRSMP